MQKIPAQSCGISLGLLEGLQAQVAQNLRSVTERIRMAEERYGRDKGSVRLCAVSKFHPAEAVLAAMGAGQRLFGENRVQEAAAKFRAVRGFIEESAVASAAAAVFPELHVIGQLQRNKVKSAVPIATVIQSADRIELIEEIERQCAAQGRKVGILFELNSGEESKSGFRDEASLFSCAEACAEGRFPHVIPKGVMTMAPNSEDERVVRKAFSDARNARDSLKERFPSLDLSELSMGMSGDFEQAVAEGSTMLRIGTAIFGRRDYA